MGESAGGQDPSMTDSFSGVPDPIDASTDQPWYKSTDTAGHAPADTVGLDVPTVPRNPANILPDEAIMPPYASKEGLAQFREAYLKSPEAVDHKLARGVHEVNKFLALPAVHKLHTLTPYEKWVADPGSPEARAQTHVEAFHRAVHDAKNGKMGVMTLARGSAAGSVDAIGNNRDILEQVTAMRGFSDFHGLMDTGRRGKAETVTIEDSADEGNFLKAMALGSSREQSHDVGIVSKFGRKSFISPLVGEDRKPTGMWLHIESDAFNADEYNPSNGYNFNVSVMIPPYGETPVYDETMRTEAMKPIHDKVAAYRRYKDSGVPDGIDTDIKLADTEQTVAKANVRLGAQTPDVSVTTDTQIIAGDQRFSISFAKSTGITLENMDIKKHSWDELRSIDLGELPLEEQRQFRAHTMHDLVAELSEVSLIPGEPIVIGRATSGPRLAGDPSLSKQHFSVELIPGGSVKITDLSSSNGTAVLNKDIATRDGVITEVPQFEAPSTASVTPVIAEQTPGKRKGLFGRRK